MRVSFEAFWLPKAGNSNEEYEDAFWPSERLWKQQRDTFCCAVADGATESSFSGLWARLLVQGLCGYTAPDELMRMLPALQRQWCEEVDSYPLPWYAEQKARRGAYAALLALQLSPAPDAAEALLTWRAFAVGDACLVQMRRNVLITSFPLSASEQFGHCPYLIGSRTEFNHRLREYVLTTSGVCKTGDTFYLMTDALACWFLSRQELRGVNEDPLREITTQRTFRRLVERERRERDHEGRPRMRNDDVTLIRLVAS
ncbi:MAG TPA: hypothetical protein VNL98_04095 [Gemmatimonadales bacterium]|nr:hypothetical protein [Gemmatimonadales bacterium]